MSEEEMINRINFLIYKLAEKRKEGKLNIGDIKLQEAIQGLLELYNKEKEKNKNLHWKNSMYVDMMLKYDYISKDKIREIKNFADKDNCYQYMIFYKKICELLEE